MCMEEHTCELEPPMIIGKVAERGVAERGEWRGRMMPYPRGRIAGQSAKGYWVYIFNTIQTIGRTTHVKARCRTHSKLSIAAGVLGSDRDRLILPPGTGSLRVELRPQIYTFI